MSTTHSKSIPLGMTVSDWDTRWIQGQILWQRPHVTTQLIEFVQRFRKVSSDHPLRILVPLCGKSVDLLWLVEQGYQVIGIEYSTKAIDDLTREQGIEKYTVTRIKPDIWRYDMMDGKLIFLQCDIFSPNLGPDCCDGPIDVIWDRNAFNAIHPSRRDEYIDAMLKLKLPYDTTFQTYADIKAKAKALDVEQKDPADSYDILLHVHEYDVQREQPPFSCPISSIHSSLSHVSTHIDLLQTLDRSSDPYIPDEMAKNCTYWNYVLYGIRLR